MLGELNVKQGGERGELWKQKETGVEEGLRSKRPVAGAEEGPALKSLVPFVRRCKAPIINGHSDAGVSLQPYKERQQAHLPAGH